MFNKEIQDINILSIDDDPVQLMIIDTMIKNLGFQSSVSRSGEETLVKLPEKKYDLLIIDVNLSDMTGFQLLSKIRQQDRYNNIKVIFMSADNSGEASGLALANGADGFIEKPINLSDIIIQVGSTLDLSIDANTLNSAIRGIMEEEIREASLVSAVDLWNYILKSKKRMEQESKITFASILTIKISELGNLLDTIDSDSYQNCLSNICLHLSKVIYSNRGCINNIYNDTITATFGTPIVYDNDTINAIICADNILKNEEEVTSILRKYSKKQSLAPIQLSICSGKLFSGYYPTMQKINKALSGTPIINSLKIQAQRVTEAKSSITIDTNTFDLIKQYINIEMIPGEVLSEPVYKIISLKSEEISQIPNLQKGYTPTDSISQEGYEKL